MNEFIVWDNKRKQFMGDGEVIISNYGENKIQACPNSMEYINDSTHNYYEDSRWTFHQYISLKDINNNKIYADCSICKVNYFSSSDWISDYCYFSFDTENLRYTVCLINEKEIVDFEASYFDCFEIIDTIQENKLRLIKE